MRPEVVRARGGEPGCLHCVIYLLVSDLVDEGHLAAIDGVLRVAEALAALIANFSDEVQAIVLEGVLDLIEQKVREAPPPPVVGHA